METFFIALTTLLFHLNIFAKLDLFHDAHMFGPMVMLVYISSSGHMFK